MDTFLSRIFRQYHYLPIFNPKRALEDNHQILEAFKSMHPIGRFGDPEEIANAVVWLLPDKASFVLGQTLLVDGEAVSR